jgi:hypothetical protein
MNCKKGGDNMTLKRARKYLWLLLALVPLVALFPRGDGGGEDRPGVSPLTALVSGEFAQSLEGYVRENLPLRQVFQRMGVSLRYLGGNREQNGVFIGEDTLIKNIAPPDESILARNNAAVQDFAQYMRSIDVPFYFTLIPTAAGVLRESLPPYAQVFDQRHFIEDVYGEMTGKLVMVDTFSPLSGSREEYLYYRTENNLTAYGGYYVYAALANRLGVTDSPSYDLYEIRYGDEKFRGDLYKLSPYENISPDVQLLFRYTEHPREYTVTHVDDDGTLLYHTLFPDHFRDMGRDMGIYLGGISAVVDVRSSAPFDRSLLVLGDETALAYLPFLANHYERVTFVDLSRNVTLFRDTHLADYDQVLMAYSVESYISPPTSPARVALFTDN